MSYNQNLMNFAKDNLSRSANYFSKKDEFSRIKELTSWLDKLNPSSKLRMIVVADDIHKIPPCGHCGQDTSIDKEYGKSFTAFCSPECRKSNKQTNKFLQDEKWLRVQRVDRRKSLEQIALESESCVETVKKWLVCYDIEIKNLKLSKSTETLQDKQALETLYDSKTLGEISNYLGVSGYCVWYWFKKHDIKMKKPNEYERKIKKTSAGEKDLLEFIRTIYDGQVISGNRSILEGKELDIYLPDLGIAFEYNGIYWHSEIYKEKNYHLNKTKECAKKGVTLYHVWSDEWDTKNKVWKSRIEHILGVTPRKVHARKCVVKQISASEKNVFLDENHLQGKDRSGTKLGLWHGTELVAVMTFMKSRYNKQAKWELMRFASKNGVSIPGGFSKLLKNFRDNNEGSIVSYADNGYSNGNVYVSNGFVEVSKTGAGYFYTDDYETRLSRLNFTKRKLAEKYDADMSKTEKEICLELGFTRVYTCGTTTHILK